MVRVIISLGSNFGNKEKNVAEAIEWLKKSVLTQVKSSKIYETPCAMNGERSYFNAVVSGFYQGTGIELDSLLKDKEHKMGRTHEMREKKLVPIDLDIVIMDGEVVKEWDYRQKFFKIGLTEVEG